MKYYTITKYEYDISIKRINTLQERKEKIFDKITSCTSTLKDIVTASSSANENKMLNYVAELEQIDNELEELKESAIKLKYDLDYMKDRISNIDEIKEKIFKMFYIDGKKPKFIAISIPCDLSTVYKYLKIIDEEIELAKKNEKSCVIL